MHRRRGNEQVHPKAVRVHADFTVGDSNCQFHIDERGPRWPFTSVKLTPLVEKQLERKYGLDKPKWQQYITVLKNLCSSTWVFQYVSVAGA